MVPKVLGAIFFIAIFLVAEGHIVKVITGWFPW